MSKADDVEQPAAEKHTLEYYTSGALSHLYVEGKERRAAHRCANCWHDRYHCCCPLIKHLTFRLNVRFIVYQHYTDYLNAGDDAKLLWCCAPERTSLFVYGKQDHDKQLCAECLKDPANTVLLFPSDKAITAEEFLELRTQSARSAQDPSDDSDASSLDVPLTIVVIDATWRHAKAMHRNLCKTSGFDIPQVQLSPTALSVYARTQSQPDRICTVEAVALLLQHLGENQENCDALVEYVKLNNRALRGAVIKREKDKVLYQGPGGNPAWYFGRRVR
mmetsp:Transcript_30210/g.65990  ORF Transcript_30210/g.65990 Transcript_30210/m.65990 type:complete len:276 (+) Transcript_30210:80-907(+)